MADRISETLLEMHFFSCLVAHYTQKFGAKFLKLYKPVPQKEAWVGFDQGWAKTELSNEQLHSELTDAIQNQKSSVQKFYIGEFLQFKAMQEVTRRSSTMPSGVTPPYLRAELDLKPNKTSRISQHETLLRLSKVKNASVYYACPMVFDTPELWQQPADIAKLRLVDVTSAPSGWATNDAHHIVFKKPMDPTPQWCSDPFPAESYGMDDRPERRRPQPMSGEQALGFLAQCIGALFGDGHEDSRNSLFPAPPLRALHLVPSLFLYEFEKAE